jgi:hypothetical protein
VDKNEEFMWAVIIIIAFLMLVLLSFPAAVFVKSVGGVNYVYSEGERTGIVYKMSKKGVLWKTYEGELSLGLLTRDANNTMVNEIFNFSVSDPEVAKKIEVCSREKQDVTLRYKEYWLRGYRYGDEQYDVVDVIPVVHNK